MNFALCTESSRNTKITVSKNSKTFVISNPKRHRVGKVNLDSKSCPIKNQKRCDYFFEIYDPLSLVIYVELKGGKVKDAVEQLKATLGYCKEVHRGLEKRCYVVASRFPKGGPQVQVLQRKLSKHQVQLIVKNKKIEVSV